MEPPKKRTLRKKKVGRPAFSRKDIPETFFRYYDAYKYGFWNKQEFALFLGVSRPTLDRYLDKIKAKKPLVSRAENKKMRRKLGIDDNNLRQLLAFADSLKEAYNDKSNSTGVYGNAFQAMFYWRMICARQERLKETAEKSNSAVFSNEETCVPHSAPQD